MAATATTLLLAGMPGTVQTGKEGLRSTLILDNQRDNETDYLFRRSSNMA